MTDRIPPEVWEAAKERSLARAGEDYEAADKLRAQIEAAGWRVLDSGTSFRLEPVPVDVEVGGEIRYGSSEAVPSRLEEAATGVATVVLVASPDSTETRRSLDALAQLAPDGVDVVLVADGLPDRALEGLRGADLATRTGSPVELVRTSTVLGQGAALNAGIRRARAPIVIVLDPCIVATGDVVTPLAQALADPSVAIAGPFGLVSEDLRRFDERVVASGGGPADAAAIQGYLMAFRRSDAISRGPFDEGFRFYRNLDIWWSLVLRDAGEGSPPRRAIVVPELPLTRGEPQAWTAMRPAERDRLSKRNFYRILDRFRARTDLSVPGT
ncbi:MAG: glycosyltransferase [Chloroflexota bacterium]